MKGRLPPTDGLQYNYCIDLRTFIKSFELNVAIINLRTGAHQIIFLSFELTVAIINLHTGAHLLIFQAFAAKRFNYINASHQVHVFASEEQIFDNREPVMLLIFSVM